VHYYNNTKPAVVVLLLFGTFLTVRHCHRFRSSPSWNRRGGSTKQTKTASQHILQKTAKDKREPLLCCIILRVFRPWIADEFFY